jgi:hypothetical protein
MKGRELEATVTAAGVTGAGFGAAVISALHNDIVAAAIAAGLALAGIALIMLARWLGRGAAELEIVLNVPEPVTPAEAFEAFLKAMRDAGRTW